MQLNPADCWLYCLKQESPNPAMTAYLLTSNTWKQKAHLQTNKLKFKLATSFFFFAVQVSQLILPVEDEIPSFLNSTTA